MESDKFKKALYSPLRDKHIKGTYSPNENFPRRIRVE